MKGGMGLIPRPYIVPLLSSGSFSFFVLLLCVWLFFDLLMKVTVVKRYLRGRKWNVHDSLTQIIDYVPLNNILQYSRWASYVKAVEVWLARVR